MPRQMARRVKENEATFNKVATAVTGHKDVLRESTAMPETRAQTGKSALLLLDKN